MLHKRREIPVAYAVFDVLALEGEPTTDLPYAKRRKLLEALDLGGNFWFLPPVFDDGPTLFETTCEQGLEGIVAKRRDSLYRPGERGWVKVKNPGVFGASARSWNGPAAMVRGSFSRDPRCRDRVTVRSPSLGHRERHDPLA